jgi:hypothetical protein
MPAGNRRVRRRRVGRLWLGLCRWRCRCCPGLRAGSYRRRRAHSNEEVDRHGEGRNVPQGKQWQGSREAVPQIPARAAGLRLHNGQPGGGVLRRHDRQRWYLHPILGVFSPGRLLTFSEDVEGRFRTPASLPLDSRHLR